MSTTINLDEARLKIQKYQESIRQKQVQEAVYLENIKQSVKEYNKLNGTTKNPLSEEDIIKQEKDLKREVSMLSEKVGNALDLLDRGDYTKAAALLGIRVDTVKDMSVTTQEVEETFEIKHDNENVLTSDLEDHSKDLEKTEEDLNDLLSDLGDDFSPVDEKEVKNTNETTKEDDLAKIIEEANNSTMNVFDDMEEDSMASIFGDDFSDDDEDIF